MPQPQYPASAGKFTFECKDEWDCCQRQQAQAKVSSMNARIRKTGGDGWRRVKKNYPDLRKEGNYFAMWFKREIAEQTRYEGGNEWGEGMAPAFDDSDFIHPCAAGETKERKTDKGRADYVKKNFSADHVHEIQYGGNPQGPLKLLDKDVNAYFGGKLRHGPNPVTGFKLRCPATKDCPDCSAR